MRKTHKDRVLEYMQDFGSITSLDAFRDLGNTRLSASIWLLRHEDNIAIASINETTKNRYGDKVNYARYYLVGSKYEEKLKKEGKI